MCDQNLSFLTFDDDFRTQKVLAGEQVWETMAVQRTSIVFGITDQPWAPSAYRINCVVVQLEKHLNDWDIIAIDIDGNSRLIRHNSVIYQLHCLISPDTIGCDSSFFYHCPECDGHIYQCNCLRNSEFVQSKPKTEREIKNVTICPKCGGKIQKLGAGVLFCLDCDWETGFNPDEEPSN